MEELSAVEMAWKGSVIQALATIFAALIAAVGLGLGIYASWKTSLHLQKNDKIFETRREIYTGLIEFHTVMMNILYGAIASPDEVKSRVSYCREAIINFNKFLDKTLFICETKNKKELVVFISFFYPKMTFFMEELTKYFNNLIKQEQLEEDYLKYYDKYQEIMERLHEGNLTDEQKEKLDSDFGHYMNILLEKDLSIQMIKIDNKNWAKILKNDFYLISDSTQEKFLNVIHLLRQEIGIETDIELDKNLNESLIIINKDIVKSWK